MDTLKDGRQGYRRLDMSKLKFSDKKISTEEALADVTPIPWSEEVLSGKKKVIISRQK